MQFRGQGRVRRAGPVLGDDLQAELGHDADVVLNLCRSRGRSGRPTPRCWSAGTTKFGPPQGGGPSIRFCRDVRGYPPTPQLVQQPRLLVEPGAGRLDAMLLSMALFGREPSAQQQAWIAMQQRIAQTLRERLVARGEQITTAQDADFLADHIADDLMSLNPSVPAVHWVKSSDS